MRFTTAVASVVLAGAIPTLAWGQMGAGYVGLYADPAGTTPCATVPPYTATVLYVIASTATETANGITGAEFRIEVTNPAGWLVSYTPPAGAQTTLGNPIDTDPNPDAGGGVNVGFSSCVAPSSGKINLGTVSVFNVNGTATNLLVKRHSQPRNANYACPLFTLCDSPTYTKYCMSPSSQPPCSTLSVPKPQATSEIDPVISGLTLHPSAIAGPPGASFTETLARGNESELWVLGQQVAAPAVICAFDGTRLTIGNIEVPLEPEVPATSDAELMQLYGQVPFVAERLSTGMTVAQAAALFNAEQEALSKRIAEAFEHNDPVAVRRLLQESPLVESFEVDEQRGGFQVRYRGIPLPYATVGDWRTARTQQATVSGETIARNCVDAIKRVAGKDGVVVMVSRAAVFSWAGAEGDQVRAQLEHIMRGGAVASLPVGPLVASQKPLSDVIVRRGGQ